MTDLCSDAFPSFGGIGYGVKSPSDSVVKGLAPFPYRGTGQDLIRVLKDCRTVLHRLNAAESPATIGDGAGARNIRSAIPPSVLLLEDTLQGKR